MKMTLLCKDKVLSHDKRIYVQISNLCSKN